MLSAYLAMLLWQAAWHWLLPAPWGNRSIWLALIACLPLLVPLYGLVRGNYRSMIWAGLLLMLYFTVGVMEFWVNAAQRVPAMVQIALAVFYVFAFKMRNRSGN